MAQTLLIALVCFLLGYTAARMRHTWRTFPWWKLLTPWRWPVSRWLRKGG